MKTFSQISSELHEMKFKAPSGHEIVKKDVQKVDGERVNITYTKKGRKIHVFLNNQKIGSYKDLDQAQKEVKTMKSVLGDMVSEGFTIKEILDEINN